MTYTPIPAGTQNWDVPVNAAFTDQDGRIAVNEGDINAIEIVNNTQSSDIATLQGETSALRNGQWTPQNQNLIAWTMDPSQAANTFLAVSGTIFFIGLQISVSVTVNNMVVLVNNAGSGLTAGQNLVGIYDAAGNLLGVSADQSTDWLSSGIKVVPLLTPVNLTPGVYYVALLSNGTTPITTVRETNLSVGSINVGLTAATARIAELAGQTTLPATVTPASRSLGNSSLWAALS